MTIGGIDYEMYFVNNPIYIQVANLGLADKVDLEVYEIGNPSNTFTFTFDVFNSRVAFDFSKIAKAMMQLPRLDQMYSSPGLTLNRTKLYLKFYSYQIGVPPKLDVNKQLTLIRGGMYAGNNIMVQDGAELIDSAKVPVWDGYPSLFSEVEGTEIVNVSLPPTEKLINMRKFGCKPIYLGWLNSKGGYSFWLFEDWQMSLKTDKGETLDAFTFSDNNQSFQSLGNESNYKITVSTRAERFFFNLFKGLSNSPDVNVWNSEEIIDYFGNINQIMPPLGATEWMRVHNNGNSFDWNANEDVKEVTFSFDFINTENRQTVW